MWKWGQRLIFGWYERDRRFEPGRLETRLRTMKHPYVIEKGLPAITVSFHFHMLDMYGSRRCWVYFAAMACIRRRQLYYACSLIRYHLSLAAVALYALLLRLFLDLMVWNTAWEYYAEVQVHCHVYLLKNGLRDV